jgi:hypothetical protein
MRKYAMQGLNEDQNVSPDQRVADPLLFLQDYLHEGDIVMADLITGWPIPAITGARIVAQAKGNPLIQEEIKGRKFAVMRFFLTHSDFEEWQWREFGEVISEAQIYFPIHSTLLSDYHCTHVLWSDNESKIWDPNLRSDLDSLCTKVVTRGPITLYKVK